MSDKTMSGVAEYRIALIAGAALLVLVFLTMIEHWDISATQTILAVFGGTLFAAPIIAKVSLNKDGFEFETVKSTARAIDDVLKNHDKAISALADNLDKLGKSLEEVRNLADEKKGAGAFAHTDLNDFISKIGPKISTLGTSLSETRGLIEQGNLSTQKVSDLVAQLGRK